MTLHYYTGETCHFQFHGPWSVLPPPARFPGKIPEPREDDFPRNPEGLTLRVEPGGALPLPANWNDRAIVFRPPCLGEREYRVVIRVESDGGIKRDTFLSLEALNEPGAAR